MNRGGQRKLTLKHQITPTISECPFARALLPAISAGWLLGSARTSSLGQFEAGIAQWSHWSTTSYAPPAQNAGGGAFGSSSPSQPCISHRRRRGRRSSRRLRRVRHPTTSGWMASRQHEDGAHWVTSSRVKHGGHRYTYAPPPTSHGSQPSNKLHARAQSLPRSNAT